MQTAGSIFRAFAVAHARLVVSPLPSACPPNVTLTPHCNRIRPPPKKKANLMPLILDIPPPAERGLAAEAFVTKVEAAGNATSSGLVGASFVLQALVLAGRGDIALSMVRQLGHCF